jgi:hypothetical protein
LHECLYSVIICDGAGAGTLSNSFGVLVLGKSTPRLVAAAARVRPFDE